jgi:hypothetical protein
VLLGQGAIAGLQYLRPLGAARRHRKGDLQNAGKFDGWGGVLGNCTRWAVFESLFTGAA